MTAGLTPELTAWLARAAGAETLLVVLDFDGVLAPLVDEPESSCATPENLAAVRRLLDLGLPVVVVSGRGLPDLSRVCRLDPRVVLVGGHGAEWPDALGHPPVSHLPDPALRSGVQAALEAIAARHPRTRVEVKPAAVVLHTRLADERVAAAASSQALAALRGMAGVRVMRGKDVVEGLLTMADKGTALRWLRSSTGADVVVAVGDDVTDEAMFRALGPADAGVKVGPGPTVAAHRVDTVADVATVLHRLAEARAAASR